MEAVDLNVNCHQVPECKITAVVIQMQLLVGSSNKREEIIKIVTTTITVASCTQCLLRAARHHLWIGKRTRDWPLGNKANQAMEGRNI